MRVAIIGGGAAGLSSARHLIEDGHECEIFEMSSQIGGTWLYTDDIETDKYGFPVYSAMYQGLRTNLPKEVMGFPDFPIPDQEKSYITQEEILEYLNQYVKHFKLENVIRTNHIVTDVRPLETNLWEITTINKPTNTKVIKQFESVMVCNGHFNEPRLPLIHGQEKFKGTIIHSRKYRSQKPFANLKVLVVGAGPSGVDIALDLCEVAEKVVFSHHIEEIQSIKYVEQKPDIRCILDESNVEFVDDSCGSFDCIIFCTGFKYSFPFLHESCGITVTDNHIEPLYKHMIHIERPTMCFIGIPFAVCAFPMFDLQVRFYCKYLNGSMKLPTKEMMRLDTERDMTSRWERGYARKLAHMMGPYQQQYYDDLASLSNSSFIPPVMVKLRDDSMKYRLDDLHNFRENIFKIQDNATYIRLKFYCKYLNGSMKLPTKEMMRLDTERDMTSRWERGYARKLAHMMGPYQQQYYDDLASMSNSSFIPPVMVKLRDDSVKYGLGDLHNFRGNIFKIQDNATYIRLK